MMRTAIIPILAATTMCLSAAAEVRVQDIARLQGQRTNKLQGYGLVVGLAGTGDGAKNAGTLRALMAMHRRYQQPVLDVNELKNNNTVALVAVEVTIPEYGAREGQSLDIVVSCLGTAKSLEGGQLLTTPLQEATLSIPDILALAGGKIEITDKNAPTRGIVRQGATLEEDFLYNFIDGQYLTLVLDDSRAGFPMAQMVARAINHEVANPAAGGVVERDAHGQLVVDEEIAIAVGPKNVRVRIPSYELARPAGFISRVMQTPLFVLPHAPARVVINRATKNISFTGSVTISPTILQLPNVGTVTIGNEAAASQPATDDAARQKAAEVEFQQLLDTLSKVRLTPQQMVEAVEHLHRTGTLHAQLIYTE